MEEIEGCVIKDGIVIVPKNTCLQNGTTLF